jgi:hypothetical protein
VTFSPEKRTALLAPAWLGWDSAWWTKARPVTYIDESTVKAIADTVRHIQESEFTCDKSEWWRVDDEGTIHESREVALEAVWEGCEGHAPDHVGLTEYELDHKRGELVRTGNVLVVDFAKWLAARGVTDEPEVKAP